MADSKITALTSISTSTDPANDPLVIVDVSDTSMAATGTTKKVTLNNLLSSSPTATGNFTITGDLTVDTSTLKVDSTNNRVGVNTASPSYPLHVLTNSVSGRFNLSNIDRTTANWARITNPQYATDASAGLILRPFPDSDARQGAGIIASGGTNNGDTNVALFVSSGVASSTSFAAYATTVSGSNVSHDWYQAAGSTAMTLNSTGLGVGGSPTAKLDIFAASGGTVFHGSNSSDSGRGIYMNVANSGLGVGTGMLSTDGSGYSLLFGINGSEKARIDTSGNVGIGVTSPSATNSTYFQALEIARVGQGLTAAKNALTSSPSSFLSNNSYATYSAGTVWNYAVSQPAAQYRLVDGAHSWHTAASGTAGNAITFTQAMTLESTGSLVLGAAAVATTATDGFLYIPSCAGAPTGVPTAKTGRVPMVVDSTNNRFYVYVSGAWKFAALI